VFNGSGDAAIHCAAWGEPTSVHSGGKRFERVMPQTVLPWSSPAAKARQQREMLAGMTSAQLQTQQQQLKAAQQAIEKELSEMSVAEMPELDEEGHAVGYTVGGVDKDR
jgi:hypothetical protein